MATKKKVFTLRLEDEVFEKVSILAERAHRSITNYIEFALLEHIHEQEVINGPLFEEEDD